MSNSDSFLEQLPIDARVKQQPGKGWLVLLGGVSVCVLALLMYWLSIGNSAAGQAGESQGSTTQETKVDSNAESANSHSPNDTRERSATQTPASPAAVRATAVGVPPNAQAGSNNPSTGLRPSLNGIFEASGYLVATRSAIVTPEVGGRITEFTADEGDTVQAQQVLARLSDQPARDLLALRQSELQSEVAALQENRADLRTAQAQLARSQHLFGQQFISESALDNDRAAVARFLAKAEYLNSRVEVAQRNLQIAKTTSANYVVRAPISGVLSKKTAQQGEYISPASFVNAALCTIVDRSSILAEINVSESHIGKVRVGQRVQMVLNGYPDQRFSAKVANIFPVADRQSGAIRVQVKFDSLDERMRPEMGVRATFGPL